MTQTKNTLKELFLHPSDEFTPIPFWFWNHALTEAEITRQIEDFHDKGVMGFVIHPRMGIPADIPYLSDRFMHYVKHAVQEAARLHMTVVLYDEAMYPSGSAHGMVVKDNPEYATRALRMAEHPLSVVKAHPVLSADSFLSLGDGEQLLSVQAVKKDTDGRIAADHTLVLFVPEAGSPLTLPEALTSLKAEEESEWSVLFFIEGFSGGTIRGVHPGEDDGEPFAPVSGDLMNPAAMDKFIHLTYDRYYEVLKEYFGNTIIAMFTDEPDVLGRNHKAGSMPWTTGFLSWWEECGGSLKDLPLLWLDAVEPNTGSIQSRTDRQDDSAVSAPAASAPAAEASNAVRRQFQKAVNKRLGFSYYGKISKWCEEHGIALTGHPHKSDDMGFLKYFQIPGQDLVWRWVAPEDGKSLNGLDSTMAKCSSDAARHAGRRRNSNECFGCCGPDGIGWAFTADDMKWYMDWMFVRGVNLLYPHAFFYSIEGEKRYGERPPDVGPHSIWWQDYRLFSDYCKRMGWLMTDSYNTTPLAILCEEDLLPWKLAGECFRNQIEFNYLEEGLILEAGSGKAGSTKACFIQNGFLQIAKQAYRVLLIEDAGLLTPALLEALEPFLKEGGKLLCLTDADDAAGEKADNTNILPDNRILPVAGLSQLTSVLDALAIHDPACKRELILTGSEASSAQDALPAQTGQSSHTRDIRISHVVKEGQHFYLLVNEGEHPFNGTAQIAWEGAQCSAQLMRPWEGTCKAIPHTLENGRCLLPVSLDRRESLVFWLSAAEQENVPAAQNSDGSHHSTESREEILPAAGTKQLPVTISWKPGKAVPSVNVAQALGTSGEAFADAAAVGTHFSVAEGTEPLTCWTTWHTEDGSSMEQFSGTVEYTAVLAGKEIFLQENDDRNARIILDLGDVKEIAHLSVNGRPAGVRMWAPYRFDLTGYLTEGENQLSLTVSNSLANGICHAKRPSGLFGPVVLTARLSPDM